jgi:Flp pilus assembly protein TadD
VVAHHYLAISYAQQGRFDESIDEYLKAREFDPFSLIIARALSLPYYLKRDYPRAREILRQANDIGPPFAYPAEIGVSIQNGLFDEALADLETAKRERKNDPILIHSTGMVYAAQGRRAEALQVIKELETMSAGSLSEAHFMAKIYAALNEKDRALDLLERGLAAGQIGDFFKDEPVWDTIRDNPSRLLKN